MQSKERIALSFDYANKHFEGEAFPASTPDSDACPAFDVYLQNEFTGTVIKTDTAWKSDSHLDRGLLAAIGSVLLTVMVVV
jgi:hypothetical protein